MLNLLEELKDKNIYISVKDNNLVIDTTEDIEESLIKRIRLYKEEIISYILKHNSNSITKHTATGKDHPVSDAQKRLWLQSLTEEGSKSYHINYPIELPSTYNLEIVRLAVLQLIKNFEIFRTVFNLNNKGEIKQSVLEEDNTGFDVEIIDLKDESDAIKVIENAVQDLNSLAFDLTKGSLLRCKIFELKDKIVVYFIFHHIIIDGVSLNIIKQNILNYYFAILHSEEISTPKLQYLDYTYWKLEAVNNGSYNVAQRYWVELLSKKIPTIDLPSYVKRPSVKTFNSYSLKTVISSGLTQKLEAFAKDNKGTLNVSLLSAIYVILNKYTSENDITLGTFTSGRNHPSLNEMPGLFVNTIVLNTVLEPQKDTSTDIFRKVKESFTKAFTYQDYPFDLLIEDLQLSPDVSRNSLFDITVVFQDYLDNELNEIYNDEIVEIGFTKRAFDINFEFINKGSFLEMITTFNVDIYNKETIIGFISHFKEVLHQFVFSSEIPLKSLDYISSEEKAILESFNSTEVNYPSDETIISLFEKQVLITPDHIAVVYEDISLTYFELNARSNQLAHYLREKYSINGDDLICIELPRSDKMIEGILGILKSGGAYVPIDVDYPQDRKDYILADTNSKVTIDESFLLDFELVRNYYSTENVDIFIRPDHLAYIIYTSGTTGNPKGVMIEHKNVVRLLFNDHSLYDFNSNDSWTLFHSYNFDFSVWECYGALLYGGSLHVITRKTAQDPGSFLSYLIKNNITILNQTPAAFYNLSEYDKLFNQGQLALRYIIFGGEALNPLMLQDFHRKYPEIRMINMYGITETTVHVTYKELSAADMTRSLSNIGKPIATLGCYILDKYHHIVPIGVVGELYISGSGLARGYLNLEELTEDKFLDNPFVPGTKMYRTGDLGRWLPDGNIEYLGRIDHQVKIRGHRIELGEIDSYVLTYNADIKSVVTEVKEHGGDKILVVYYVSGSPIDKHDLSQYLAGKLPQYMLPGFYVELDHIPLTSNGKVDRKSLPEVSSTDMIKNEYVAARNEEEQVLVSICEQVLKYRPISIRDNYYNLGGDSIKSIQIVSRLRQQGYSLKVEHILQYPILEELAGYITTDIVEIDQSVVIGESILTPIQRYFFESEDIVNKNHYNQSVILKSTEKLSVAALETSIKRLVEHHDALRMVYSEKAGFWVQYNSGIENNHYHLQSFDLKDSGSNSEELSRLQEIGEELQSSIDITSGVLFHVGHVSMSDGERLILVVHHLVVDGVSWRILLEDLGKLYKSEVQGLSYELPSKTDSFQRWGNALEDYSKSSALSKERLYWEGIESETYASITTDYPVKGKQILENSLGFDLNTDTTKLLQTLAGRKYNAEINDVLLTGLALSLKDQFGVCKTKVLMEGHGRETMGTGLDISRTVGWFTSVYPFNLDISDDSQPVMVSVKEGMREIPNKGIGYGILNYLNEPFTPKSLAWLQFNYLGDFDDAGNYDTGESQSLFSYSSENIGPSVSLDNLFTDILLDVSGMTVNGVMNINIRFSNKVFTANTIESLLSAYQSHLESMIRESEDSSVALTPSDLTYKYKGLSFSIIEEISKDAEIEDIYELSPMQQGLYYHWLVNPKGLSYFMQTSYRVKASDLDLSLIEKAFGALVNRYTILRTSFENRYGEVPLQIVHKEARVDFKHLILASELELDNIKQGDIDRGFILSEPTQMRLLVVELPDGYYEFIWSHHHIIMDGWCLSILINDFSTILGSLQNGISIPLPDTEKYSSYIKWLESVDKEEALAYWKNYLQGIDSPTLIPFVNTDEASSSHYLTETLSIRDHDFGAIENFCQDLGITLNTYVQGAWSYLLSSYNSSEEVVFGSVVSGRPAEIPGIENMVGLFINTIPVCARIGEEDTPRSLLNQIHQDSIQSSRYHFNSLAEIQSLSSLGKELINHIIVFENYVKNDKGNVETSSYAGLSSESVGSFEQTNYPLTIVAVPDHGGLHIEFRYDASLLSTSSMKFLVSHFKEVLHQFVFSSEIPLKSLDYISSEEKAILESFNSTEVNYPSDETIISLFEKQVLITPDHIAVVYEDISLTYFELNARSNQLAHYLREKYSINGDDLICIELPRSDKMIEGILGILKSGGAYVPIDVDYPQDRKDYILADTNSKVTIDESFLLDFELVRNYYSTENVDIFIRPDHLAYIIYTSGTTGNPKGVMIEHKNVVTLIYWSQTVFPKEDFDIIYAATSYCFDISVYEMFLALSCGKKLRILQNAFKISDYAKVDKNILINTVPSVLLSISSEELFENVKILNLAGEALTYKHIRHVPLESLKLYNIYGPSEDTVYSTFFKVKRKAVTVPIGKPISNTQVYILDKYHHIVPIGVVGELYISGSGLARGYLNLEELTEDKFLNNPFVPGTKMYRTGDLGRWLPDGNIEYLGRIDHQVKIRGHRIELGEIDSYVLTYSADIKSVVTEVKEHGGDKILVVYYVSGSPIDKHDLSQYLAGKLPQYMLPGFYVELESIPLTNNGKIDRNNLPAVLSKDLIKNEYVAPVTVHQRILVEVCAQVLKYESISIKDNFYNLGGDSIKSIQIVSRLRQQGYSLKVEHILQYPVLEDLSRYITSEVVLIDQSAVTGTSILTPIQRYFFESEDIVNKSHYNQSVILKSIQRLSFSSLEASIKRLVEHHDALRMVYNNVEGIWTQFNADATSKHYSFEYFDLRTSASSKSEELESLQKIGENLQSNIDISSGILFNVGHVSMKDGDRIILVVHHLVIDGVSWRILLEDLGRLYESVVLGLSFDLPTKTDSFQNWGKALDEYSRSLELSKERLYWEGVESKQYDTIVTDYPVLGKTILENTLGFTLTSETTKLLQTRAGRKYNADINDVLLTGLGLALQDYFGVRTTKVLMEGHGREVMKTGLDLSRTIGWFTSVYPFSLDISDESQPSLVSVKESLRRIPNKGIGYGVLHYLQQEILSVSKASVLFNYLGDFNDIGAGDSGTEAITSSILSYSSEYIGSPVSRDNLLTDILLDVSGMTVNGEMSIHIRFSGKVFKESTIERLLSYYRTHLETMIKESEASSVVLTPSDLTYNRLPFTTLAEMSKDSEVEDIYELSPMQQGLYYHWLLDTNSSAYFMQTSYRIKSVDLDLSHVEEAFRILVNRYTILRTSFENRYWEVPLQIVHKNARVEFMHLQLESGYQLASIKNDDIHRGFNLGEPTQMRLMVVELLDDYYEFIWSHHHIIMDGWCLSILINDFSTILQSLQQENTLSLPEPEKYSSYIKWLSTVNRDSTLEYWRRYLDGLSSTNLIPFEKPKENIGYDLASHVSFINRATYKELVKFCQDLGVTLNTYVQAAWSYLLSSYNHSEDIIFGAVVSGRPPEVSGIESMVGLFINTIPIRVIFNSNDTPRSILNKVHEDSIKSTDHHYLSLAEIQLKRNLINHILIFENFLMSNDIANNSGSNKMTVEKSNLHLQTTYDFNFEILPTGQDMRILVDYNKNVFDDYSVANIVKTFEDILVFFKDNIDLPLHEAKEKLEKQSIYFKAVVQQNIKEIITSMDADFIKQKNSKKLSAFIKK